MTRYIRPGFISTPQNTRSEASPWASCSINVRTPAGDISEPIEVQAGGVRGRERCEVRIPAGFAVEVVKLAGGRTEIIARPE